VSQDRARDDRRSVGSFEKMMGGLGNAAIATTPGETPKSGFVHHWIKPTASDTVGSAEQKVESQHRKGLITDDERAQERVEITAKEKGMGGFY